MLSLERILKGLSKNVKILSHGSFSDVHNVGELPAPQLCKKSLKLSITVIFVLKNWNKPECMMCFEDALSAVPENPDLWQN